MEPITASGVALGTVKMIGMGAALCIGFWMGKKLTDRIDVFIASHSSEFKELVSSMVAKESEKNGGEEVSQVTEEEKSGTSRLQEEIQPTLA